MEEIEEIEIPLELPLIGSKTVYRVCLYDGGQYDAETRDAATIISMLSRLTHWVEADHER